MRRALVGLGLVLLVACAIGVGLAYPRFQPARPGSDERVSFAVERGQGLSQIARALEANGLVLDARALILLARLRGWEGLVQAGEYELSPGQTPEAILRRIMSGRVQTHTVVLPEGIRASEVAQRLGEAGLADPSEFLAAVESPELARSLGIQADGLEGYLYPETYRIPRNLSAEQLVRILVGQFEEIWRQIEPEAAGLDLSRHEIVTLASIVEKETAAPEERPLIAAVFLNRLRQGMRLETDPTVIYGIPEFDGNLRRIDLQNKANPYNTYQIPGLPPGPIASPGADALRAVVNPADSDYIYFVSRNDGTHHFSRTYREHVNAVNRYQKRRRAR